MQAEAETSKWTNGNRIAISADGNPDADADDVGATPFSLAVLAKAGLQENLVHYDFNNFLNYKKIDADNNRMWLSAMGGQARWGFDRSRFFDAALDPDGAVKHLTSVINKSTEKDPLYLIVGGPMELIYRALEAADSNARQHVKLVSHHNYNEYFKPRLWHTTHDNYGAVASQEGHFSTPIYELTAGDHYFWICGRSGGMRIDKIHFFKEGVAGFKSDQEPTTPILPGSEP